MTKNPASPKSSAGDSPTLPRREFLQTAAAVTATTAITSAALAAEADANDDAEQPLPILKSVKWGMIRLEASVLEKFQMQKELGYDGIEMSSPTNVDLDEAIAASRKTGMPIHGVVDSVPCKHRLSSADGPFRWLLSHMPHTQPPSHAAISYAILFSDIK